MTNRTRSVDFDSEALPQANNVALRAIFNGVYRDLTGANPRQSFQNDFAELPRGEKIACILKMDEALTEFEASL